MGKVWAGVAGGVLAGAILLGVGLAAFDAGRDSETTTQVVTADGQVSDGTVIRVVDDGWHDRGPGPAPFFFFVGFLALLALIFVVVRRNHGYGRRGWGGPWGGGPWGPGPWGPGASRAAFLDEWHRQAHAGGEVGGPPPPAPPSDGAWTAPA